MMRTLAACVAAWLALGGAGRLASACEYTVRDVGFAQLEPAPYHLYVYVGQETQPSAAASLSSTARATLVDSNVAFSLLDAQVDKDHPAMKHLERCEVKTLPAAILVSWQGRSLVVPFSNGTRPFEEAVWSALDGVVSSHQRDQMVERLVEAYGLIVLAEGPDRAANEQARQVCLEAIKATKEAMAQADNSSLAPPQLMVIGREAFTAERILLWSLGLDTEGIREPVVAVLYGRGRRLGPLLRGASIKPEPLRGILALIAASCECGLDRSWLLGTMIPLRWDTKTQARAARALGFDAQNPLVKAEIGAILSSGLRMRPEGSEPSAMDWPRQQDRLGGYYEEPIEYEAPAQAATLSPAQMQTLSAQNRWPTTMPVGQRAPAASSLVLPTTLGAVAGLGLLALAGGVWVLWRAGGRIS